MSWSPVVSSGAGECSLVALAGAFSACAFLMMPRAYAQSTADAGDSASPALEEIVVSADRKNSYSADLVQAGSFRGARQLDTPLTVNVIPNTLIEAQQSQSL